ncbi:hypothetical protein A2344_03325 [Candidatus Peregrinibacteria bacterium RIFOXYB12_FULL_41_12]|nr:MAG: hypothetical protein A2244_02060 [Candidatus Peregrinibacteria bacterium RIFOXYA2_FULL_41_18]OGJ48933.1 MAG: hypothetical protein A2344_03325 [Candidatus Peregrinibacteria bacterium RIFOXYB12_FULL_41_12]OGJ51493.1 MAG: hypothetical protein A2336_02255 [Candidatus Peregrinibacteria bacterium RIFOXYB2_FULL_41_88]OGJ52598.1 MAG: hypothetical protein A2448_02465 [Candidatus Peregrinibacteria bacterium RIFOXYC2_FULL_41_22]
MENKKIAQIFQEIGDILELKGDNPFKIIAYNKAAQVISNYPYDLREIYKKDPDLVKQIPGIGESLAVKIEEILATGDCQKHLKLVKEIKHGVLDIMRLRGIGPKKTKLFYDKLGIDSVQKLKSYARRGLLRELTGMGEKSELAVLEAIEAYGRLKARMPISDALNIAEEIVSFLRKSPEVKKAEYAGSLRRRLETVGDIDILACGSPKIVEHFCSFPEVEHIESKGDTKATVVLNSGIQVDLRVVPIDSFGAALYYFTGSKAHNIATRKIAQKMGLKINEYGVFNGKKCVAGKTEEEIFKSIHLPYIIPEMREDMGEIELAASREWKKFKPIEISDIQGDLHSHTNWSDGSLDLEQAALEAKKRGYTYLAITDHSGSLKIAHGLDKIRLEAQMKEIDKLNKKLRGIVLLKGVEVDILKDGSLDMPDSVLKKLDIVVASVHTYFKLTAEEQTARIIRAIQNPFVNILGHPTGKLLGMREAYEVDLMTVMRAARARDVALELNCNPKRLDLNAQVLRAARDMGLMISLDTDAHGSSQLEYIEYGVHMARRGWLEKKNVLNTMELQSLKKFLRHG